MIEGSSSSPSHTAGSPMGGDGWLTLLLSALIITVTGGITLLWQWMVVWRQARCAVTCVGDNIKMVLIPGVQLKNDKPDGDFLLRLQRGMALHRLNGMKLLLMGGITGNNSVSEAAAGRTLLLQEGVATECLLLEDRSRNTLENLRNAREQLRAAKTENIALVSNRYHLARCMALAEGLGMHPVPCAAEEHFAPLPKQWPRLLLEAFYLHWYHTGRVWSQLTRNRKSLARIS